MSIKIKLLCLLIGIISTDKVSGRRPSCPTSCLEGDSLVCGSDGNIYASECELRMKNCGKSVSVVPKEECLAGRQVLCDEECDDVDDPVCGTDSHTYRSPCHLGVETCKRGVKLAHHGACNNLNQEEVCPHSCEDVEDEVVCASNGNVYKNECEMRLNTCGERVVRTSLDHCYSTRDCGSHCVPTSEGRRSVCASNGQIYDDDCQMKQRNCGKHVYEIPMVYCIMSREEYKDCPKDCQGLNQTKLCGSDGNVYNNECELRMLTCGSSTPVTVVNMSECSSRVEHCNRLMCSGAYDPVCGIDGVTYSNMCRLNMAKCLRGIRVAHLGVCHNHLVSEVCPDQCPPSSVGDFNDPVCGSDGNVYTNACDMKRLTCGQKVVPLAWKNCRTTAHCDVNCPNISRPICGADGNLYKSKCHMLYKNCGKHIYMVPLHQCLKRVFKGCYEICPMTFAPCCGTDTKTYSNPCFLRIETCRSKGKVKLAYRGRCGFPSNATESVTPVSAITDENGPLQLVPPSLIQSRKIKSHAN
ncbi:hypothetical protein CHUAL_014184 [Chamberlinius hualienensis]